MNPQNQNDATRADLEQVGWDCPWSAGLCMCVDSEPCFRRSDDHGVRAPRAIFGLRVDDK